MLPVPPAHGQGQGRAGVHAPSPRQLQFQVPAAAPLFLHSPSSPPTTAAAAGRAVNPSPPHPPPAAAYTAMASPPFASPRRQYQPQPRPQSSSAPRPSPPSTSSSSQRITPTSNLWFNPRAAAAVAAGNGGSVAALYAAALRPPSATLHNSGSRRKSPSSASRRRHGNDGGHSGYSLSHGPWSSLHSSPHSSSSSAAAATAADAAAVAAPPSFSSSSAFVAATNSPRRPMSARDTSPRLARLQQQQPHQHFSPSPRSVQYQQQAHGPSLSSASAAALSRAQLMAQWAAEKEQQQQRYDHHLFNAPETATSYSDSGAAFRSSPARAAGTTAARGAMHSPTSVDSTSPRGAGEGALSHNSSAESLLEQHRWTSSSVAEVNVAPSSSRANGTATPAYAASLNRQPRMRSSPPLKPMRLQQQQSQSNRYSPASIDSDDSPRTLQLPPPSSQQPQHRHSHYYPPVIPPRQFVLHPNSHSPVPPSAEPEPSEQTFLIRGAHSPRKSLPAAHDGSANHYSSATDNAYDEAAAQRAVEAARLLRQQRAHAAATAATVWTDQLDELVPALPSALLPVLSYSLPPSSDVFSSPHEPLPLQPQLRRALSSNGNGVQQQQQVLDLDHFYCAWNRTRALDAQSMPMDSQWRVLQAFWDSGGRGDALLPGFDDDHAGRPNGDAQQQQQRRGPATAMISANSSAVSGNDDVADWQQPSQHQSLPPALLASLLRLAPMPLVLCLLDLCTCLRRSFASFARLRSCLSSAIHRALGRWRRARAQEGVATPEGSDKAWKAFVAQQVDPLVDKLQQQQQQEQMQQLLQARQGNGRANHQTSSPPLPNRRSLQRADLPLSLRSSYVFGVVAAPPTTATAATTSVCSPSSAISLSSRRASSSNRSSSSAGTNDVVSPLAAHESPSTQPMSLSSSSRSSAQRRRSSTIPFASASESVAQALARAHEIEQHEWLAEEEEEEEAASQAAAAAAAAEADGNDLLPVLGLGVTAARLRRQQQHQHQADDDERDVVHVFSPPAASSTCVSATASLSSSSPSPPPRQRPGSNFTSAASSARSSLRRANSSGGGGGGGTDGDAGASDNEANTASSNTSSSNNNNNNSSSPESVPATAAAAAALEQAREREEKLQAEIAHLRAQLALAAAMPTTAPSVQDASNAAAPPQPQPQPHQQPDTQEPEEALIADVHPAASQPHTSKSERDLSPAQEIRPTSSTVRTKLVPPPVRVDDEHDASPVGSAAAVQQPDGGDGTAGPAPAPAPEPAAVSTSTASVSSSEPAAASSTPADVTASGSSSSSIAGPSSSGSSSGSGPGAGVPPSRRPSMSLRSGHHRNSPSIVPEEVLLSPSSATSPSSQHDIASPQPPPPTSDNRDTAPSSAAAAVPASNAAPVTSVPSDAVLASAIARASLPLSSSSSSSSPRLASLTRPPSSSSPRVQQLLTELAVADCSLSDSSANAGANGKTQQEHVYRPARGLTPPPGPSSPARTGTGSSAPPSESVASGGGGAEGTKKKKEVSPLQLPPASLDSSAMIAAQGAATGDAGSANDFASGSGGGGGGSGSGGSGREKPLSSRAFVQQHRADWRPQTPGTPASSPMSTLTAAMPASTGSPLLAQGSARPGSAAGTTTWAEAPRGSSGAGHERSMSLMVSPSVFSSPNPYGAGAAAAAANILLSPSLAARRGGSSGSNGGPHHRNNNSSLGYNDVPESPSLTGRMSPAVAAALSSPSRSRPLPHVASVPALPPPPATRSTTTSDMPVTPGGVAAAGGGTAAPTPSAGQQQQQQLPNLPVPLSSLLAAGQLQPADQNELESVLLDYPLPVVASQLQSSPSVTSVAGGAAGASSAVAAAAAGDLGLSSTRLLGVEVVDALSRADDTAAHEQTMGGGACVQMSAPPLTISPSRSPQRSDGTISRAATARTVGPTETGEASDGATASSSTPIDGDIPACAAQPPSDASSSEPAATAAAAVGEEEEEAAVDVAASSAESNAPTPRPSTRAPVVSMEHVAQFLLSGSPSLFVSPSRTRAALTTTDVEYLCQVGHTELSTLQHLQSLTKSGRAFEDFHHLLLAVHELQTYRVARRNYVVASLSYPRCTLFAAATEPVHVDEQDVDWLVDSCEAQVEWIDYNSTMLDVHGWRVNSFQKLAQLLQRIHAQVQQQVLTLSSFLSFDESGDSANGALGMSPLRSPSLSGVHSVRGGGLGVGGGLGGGGGGGGGGGHHSRCQTPVAVNLPYPVPLRLLRDSNGFPRTMDNVEADMLVQKLRPLQHVSCVWAVLRQEQLRAKAAQALKDGTTATAAMTTAPPSLPGAEGALESALPPLAILQSFALERASFSSHSSLFRAVWAAGDYPPVPPFIHALMGLTSSGSSISAATEADGSPAAAAAVTDTSDAIPGSSMSLNAQESPKGGGEREAAARDQEQVAFRRAKEKLKELQARRYRKDAAIAAAEAAAVAAATAATAAAAAASAAATTPATSFAPPVTVSPPDLAGRSRSGSLRAHRGSFSRAAASSSSSAAPVAVAGAPTSAAVPSAVQAPPFAPTLPESHMDG